MSSLLFAQVFQYVFGILLFLSAVFLILLILVQRGRGGGLTGALGGMGGQSAFGTKAGDLFTRITIVCAMVWLLLCLASVKVLSSSSHGPFAKPAPLVKTEDVDRAKSSGAGSSTGSEKPTTGGEPQTPQTKSADEEKKPAADQATDQKPVEEEPAADKPATDKPATDKPAEDKPAEDKPAEDKPTADKPGEGKPSEEKPAAEKPAEDKPTEASKP